MHKRKPLPNQLITTAHITWHDCLTWVQNRPIIFPLILETILAAHILSIRGDNSLNIMLCTLQYKHLSNYQQKL